MTRTIGRPYLWLCEGDPCKRLRFDRYGQARNLRALEIGPDDPGEGQRYHPECRPQPSLWDRADVVDRSAADEWPEPLPDDRQ